MVDLRGKLRFMATPMLKLLRRSGLTGAIATTAIAASATASTAATLFQTELNGLQVVSPEFPNGIPTMASGTATFALNDAETALIYEIDLDGVTLKPQQADRTDLSDVTKIHIHVGEFGNNGPHVLNIFGLPREDDADLTVDYAQGILSGIWDDGDAINPSTGELFDPTAGGTTKLFSNFVDELKTGGLYLQVHTVEFDSSTVPGELRGQIEATEPASVPEGSTVAGILLVAGGLLCSATKRHTAA